MALFATENLVHYPVGAMALLGLARMWSNPRDCVSGPGRMLALMFACIWIPMLLASLDAVEPTRAAKTTLLYLHFMPAAYFVLWSCRDVEVLRLVAGGTAGLALFAGFDAFIQLIWHVDLFGYPYDDGTLKGVFHPKQRLGLFLAVFAPLYVDVVIRWCRTLPRVWFLLVPVLIVILMSLKRSAWIMLLVAMLGYVMMYFRHARVSPRRLRLLPVLAVLAIGAATIALSPTLQQRLEATSGVFSSDSSSIDAATSYRWTLWRTARSMFADNWLSGVGPRGYRHAYASYADADDFWIDRSGTGQTHPHLLFLEVAAETGIVGLAGLIGFYVLLLGELVHARPASGIPVWLLCAATAWFPLNAHLAFYGSYWSTLVWLLVPIGIAAAHPLADR